LLCESMCQHQRNALSVCAEQEKMIALKSAMPLRTAYKLLSVSVVHVLYYDTGCPRGCVHNHLKYLGERKYSTPHRKSRIKLQASRTQPQFTARQMYFTLKCTFEMCQQFPTTKIYFGEKLLTVSYATVMHECCQTCHA